MGETEEQDIIRPVVAGDLTIRAIMQITSWLCEVMHHA